MPSIVSEYLSKLKTVICYCLLWIELCKHPNSYTEVQNPVHQNVILFGDSNLKS